MTKLVAIANVLLVSVATASTINRLIGKPTGMLDERKRRQLESTLNMKQEVKAGLTGNHRGASKKEEKTVDKDRSLWGNRWDDDDGYYYYGTDDGYYHDYYGYGYMKTKKSKGGYRQDYYYGRQKYDKSKSYGKKGGYGGKKRGPIEQEVKKFCEMFVTEEHFSFMRADTTVANGNSTDPGTVFIWGGQDISYQDSHNNESPQISGTCTRLTEAGSSSYGQCTFTLVNSRFDQLEFSGVIMGEGGNLAITGGSGSFAGVIGDAKLTVFATGEEDPFDDAVFYDVYLALGLIVCPPQPMHDSYY